eukprot:91793_1
MYTLSRSSGIFNSSDGGYCLLLNNIIILSHHSTTRSDLAEYSHTGPPPHSADPCAEASTHPNGSRSLEESPPYTPDTAAACAETGWWSDDSIGRPTTPAHRQREPE